jgi:hypothetical protein
MVLGKDLCVVEESSKGSCVNFMSRIGCEIRLHVPEFQGKKELIIIVQTN